MKVLVVLCALVAMCVAEPGYYGGHAVPHADHVPAALNGLTPHGTPIDTPAVQHARAAHLAAVSKAHSHAYAAPYGGYAGAPYAGVHYG